jgi:very-short-patch-repair endonuclease
MAVASAQRGRVSREQLAAIGVTSAMIVTRVRGGLLTREHRSVYAIGPSLSVEWGPETGALLAVGPPVVLGHESAARLWGLWPAAPPAGGPVEVCVPGDRARTRDGITVHRHRSLAAADVTTRDGLPVTTAARTLLDLAEHHHIRAVERALDEALARHLTSPTKLRELLARSPGRAGAPPLAALLDPERARGVTREAGEEDLLALVRRAGLPDPERNVSFGRFTVDFYWPEARLAVEFDSFTWHTGAAAFRRDREKDAHLRDAGIELHRVTWAMLEEQVALISRLSRAIALRSREPR